MIQKEQREEPPVSDRGGGEKNQPIVELSQLRFSWPGSPSPLLAINKFTINSGERVYIRGNSGCGKSTLLGIISGILVPENGEVTILNQDCKHLSSSARDRFRADHIGYIFQLFNLVPYLSVIDNVILPCQFSHIRKKKALARSNTLEQEAQRLLAFLGLEDQTIQKRAVVKLSVGQQQRVAAARALIGAPPLIIADEPTSSLDANKRQAFLKLLFSHCKEAGSTLIFVSHDSSLASFFTRTIEFEAINSPGRIAEEKQQ